MILGGRYSEVTDTGDMADFWVLSESVFNCRLSETSKEACVLELMPHTKPITVWGPSGGRDNKHKGEQTSQQVDGIDMFLKVTIQLRYRASWQG